MNHEGRAKTLDETLRRERVYSVLYHKTCVLAQIEADLFLVHVNHARMTDRDNPVGVGRLYFGERLDELMAEVFEKEEFPPALI